MILHLKSHGLQLEIGEEQKAQSDVLESKSFVNSGSFEDISRNDLKALIEKHVGKNIGSVSGNTDYIIAGENMGPSKREKAEKLGVPIISILDFREMISNT